MVLAVAPLTDLTTWLRSSGLEIVLFVSGALLVTRVARWVGATIIRRIETRPAATSDLVRSEASKHGHVVTQVTMWTVIVLTYCVTAVLVLQRLGVPITGLIAPATVVGVPVPSSADISRVREVLQQVGAAIREDEQFGPLLLDAPSVVGVESLEVDTVHMRVVARTLPGKQFDVGRELRARVAVALRAEGINSPAQLDTAEPTEAR